MIFQPTLHYEWITPKRLPPEAKVKATHARKQRNRWHQRLARYLHIKQCFLLIYIQNLFLWLRTRGNIASAAPSATFLSADVQFVGKPPRKVWAKSFHTNLKKSMTWNVRTDLETHSMSIILTNIHQLQVEETFLVSYDASLVLHHSAEKTVFGSRGPQLPKHRSFTRSHFHWQTN